MNAKLIAVFGVLAVILGFSKPALADSVREANTDSSYTLSGDSLTGIDTVTAEDDFERFFLINEQNQQQDLSNLDQSLSLNGSDITLESAERGLAIGDEGLNLEFNDGLKVRFDLGE